MMKVQIVFLKLFFLFSSQWLDYYKKNILTVIILIFFHTTYWAFFINVFFDVDVIVYPLSTKAPVNSVKERLSNPYSSILG